VPMLDEALRKDVADVLAMMVEPVTVHFYPKPGEAASDAMDALLHDVASLSDKVLLQAETGPAPLVAPDVPEEMTSSVVVLSADGRPTGVRYLGFPGGREFGTFLQDVVNISAKVAPRVSPDTVRYIQNLERPLHLQVFVTPT